MKRRGMTVLAVVFGGICAFAVYAYTANVQAEAQAARDEALARYGGEQVSVCVAVRDIAAGETLDSSNVEVRQWLVDLLPRGAQEDLQAIAGKQATSGIGAGEVITSQRLEGETGEIDVPAGMQALGIEADSAAAVGGAVVPGSSVDVYATGSDGAHLIMSGARVLASGSESSTRMWVTLAVNPENVQELITAAQNSRIYLTLPASTEGDEGA